MPAPRRPFGSWAASRHYARTPSAEQRLQGGDGTRAHAAGPADRDRAAAAHMGRAAGTWVEALVPPVRLLAGCRMGAGLLGGAQPGGPRVGSAPCPPGTVWPIHRFGHGRPLRSSGTVRPDAARRPGGRAMGGRLAVRRAGRWPEDGRAWARPPAVPLSEPPRGAGPRRPGRRCAMGAAGSRTWRRVLVRSRRWGGGRCALRRAHANRRGSV